MSQTFVSKMLRLNGAGVMLRNVFGFNTYNKVGSSDGTCLLVARSFHVEPCVKFRSACGKVRRFHTTPQNNLHPLLWVIVRPIAKVSAMIAGRGVRKWWRHLPKNKKALFIQTLNRRKFGILGSAIFLGGAGIVYYETHVQVAPIINRRRFLAFNSSQILDLADFQHKTLIEDFERDIFPETHCLHKIVQGVADRIINANRDIPEINEKSWRVTVVEHSTQNAFVLPNGQIFVFQGMLDLCFNEDQLGIILGHEIAHAVLNHGAEGISYMHLLDWFTIVLVGAIWAILPSDIVSALVQWLLHKFVHVLMELPFSRQMEAEADEIGLNLAAKACYDIRESSAFWARLGKMEKEDGDQHVDWLSTHPAHEVRSAALDEKIPQAVLLRLACKCAPLPPQDPRIQPLSVSNSSNATLLTSK